MKFRFSKLLLCVLICCFISTQKNCFSQPLPPNSTPAFNLDDETRARIEAMLPVFDSVIRVMGGSEKPLITEYTITNANLAWDVLYHLAVNHAHLHPLIEVNDEITRVPHKVMQELATACFSDYDDLVAVPKTFDSISINEAYNSFDLQNSDAGASFCRIISISPAENAGFAVTVGLFDDENEEMTASYSFVVVENTYASLISDPLFYYAIDSVVPAN